MAMGNPVELEALTIFYRENHLEMVDFQLPRVITRGYILNQVIFMATGHFPWLSVN
jgi:hypothetical protein